MKINILGAHLLSSAALASIVAAAKAEGHEVVTAATDSIDHLESVVEQHFPDVITAIQKGIADLKDDSLSGGEKAVKVADDVLSAAETPAVLKELAGARDFFVGLVTKTFAKGVPELVAAASEVADKLASAV